MWNALAISAVFLHVLCLSFKDSRTLDSIYSYIHRRRQEAIALEEFSTNLRMINFFFANGIFWLKNSFKILFKRDSAAKATLTDKKLRKRNTYVN